MLSNLVVSKIKKHEIWPILHKNLKKSKMAITFAYDVEKKRIIYQTEEHDEESKAKPCHGPGPMSLSLVSGYGMARD